MDCVGRERKSLKLKDSELVSLGQGRAGVSRGAVDPLGPPGCRPPPTPTVNCGNVPQALPTASWAQLCSQGACDSLGNLGPGSLFPQNSYVGKPCPASAQLCCGQTEMTRVKRDVLQLNCSSPSCPLSPTQDDHCFCLASCCEPCSPADNTNVGVHACVCVCVCVYKSLPGN